MTSVQSPLVLRAKLEARVKKVQKVLDKKVALVLQVRKALLDPQVPKASKVLQEAKDRRASRLRAKKVLVTKAKRVKE